MKKTRGLGHDKDDHNNNNSNSTSGALPGCRSPGKQFTCTGVGSPLPCSGEVSEVQ